MHNNCRRLITILLALIISLSTLITVIATEDEFPPQEETDDFVQPETVLDIKDVQIAGLESASYIWKGKIIGFHPANYFDYVYPFDGSTHTMSYSSVHAIRLNGTDYPAYCIEPALAIDSGNAYNGTFLDIETMWSRLSMNQQQAIALTLLYGYPNGITADTRVIRDQMHAATQAIIWEIALGMRSETAPFEVTDTRMRTLFDGGGTYLNNMGVSQHVGDVQIYYDIIDKALRTHNMVPSFASCCLLQAPSYTMTADGDGTYSLTLTDTNGVLERYTFTDTDELHFFVSESTLTVTASSGFDGEITVTPTKQVPSLDDQVFIVWSGITEESAQKLVSAYTSVVENPLPAFFKIKVREVSGQISILKTDTYGNTLAGAEFLLEWSQDGSFWEPVYFAENTVQQGVCSSADLSSRGTLTTGEDGLVTFEGLNCAIFYRLTEVKCPDGFTLLTDSIYCGKLDTLESPILELTMTNTPTFTLPQTGSNSLLLSEIGIFLCLAACVRLLLRYKEY